MNKTKKLVLVALSLVIAGLIICAVGLFSANFDFSKLTLSRFTSNTHTVEEVFTKISVDTTISDLCLAVSQDDTCQVVCREEANYFHTVSVENNTLTIRTQDNRMWYEHIGITFGNSHKVTVYLPQKAYESLAVTCRTADVEIPKGFSFGSAEIKTTTGDVAWQGSMVNDLLIAVSSGDISVEDTGCQTLIAETNTGDIRLATTVATQKMIVTTDTGDVRFDRSDSKAISVQTDTGDVTGTLLSNKIFVTEVDTGDIRVPALTDGLTTEDICRITTDTGDIHIELS